MTRRAVCFLALASALAGAIPAIGVAMFLSEKRIEAAELACEVSKEDRLDNARSGTAEATYKEHVIHSGFPSGDIKQAATNALEAWSESSNQQRIRLYDCEKLIRDREKVIDEDAVREAKGNL